MKPQSTDDNFDTVGTIRFLQGSGVTSAAFEESSPFAAALREARSARSLSLGDAARALLLSDNQVAGLEADDFASFYGASYAERAARRYAEFLGVDLELSGAPRGESLSAGAVEAVPATTPLASPIKVDGAGVLRSPGLRWALVSALVLVAGVVGLKRFNRPVAPPPVALVQDPSPVAEAPPAEAAPAAPVTEPAVEAEAPVAPAPASAAPVVVPAPVAAPVAATANVPDDRDHRFFLVVNRDVTIRAKDVYGTVLLEGLQRPALGRRVVGEPPFEVQVSDDEAVEIYYRGQRIRPGANTYDGIVATVVR